MSRATSPIPAPLMPARATNTTSYPDRAPDRRPRHASLSRRRALFLMTAVPTPRPHTNPLRGPSNWGRTYSTIHLPEKRRPPRSTSANSGPLRIVAGYAATRDGEGVMGCGPGVRSPEFRLRSERASCHAVWRECAVLPGCACVPGTHGASSGGDCLAGRCVSSRALQGREGKPPASDPRV